MKVHDENGRKLVEYENQKGAKLYTDAERFIKDEDFSDKIDEVETAGTQGKSGDAKAEIPEEAKGVKGFEKLSEKEQLNHLKNKIPDFIEEE